MEKNYKYVCIGILSLFIMAACSKDNDDVTPEPDQVIEDIETSIVTGEWMISSYMDSGVDETTDFDAFTFTFNADGVVSASSEPEMLTGAWALDSDSMSSDVDFILFFGVADTHLFNDLIEDWDVVSYTANTISLEDVSENETDTLVFTRK